MISRCSDRMRDRETAGCAPRRDRDQPARAFRVDHGERERGHAAHRRAEHRVHLLDAEMIERLQRRRGRCPRRAAPGTSVGSGSRWSGSIDAGPVEPKQLPREFTQITKYRLVSIGLSGPSMSSHHPVPGSSGEEAAWAEGDSPVKIRTALSRSRRSVRPRSRRRRRDP